MTKKHYEAIARILADVLEHEQDDFDPQAHGVNFTTYYYIQDVARQLAEYFASDNPRFDRARFLSACGVERCLTCNGTGRISITERCMNCNR